LETEKDRSTRSFFSAWRLIVIIPGRFLPIELSSSTDLEPMENQAAPAQQAQNRRRHRRYACEGQAEVFLPHGGFLLRGRILDLSLSGCFIETRAISLERGTHVEVYFVAHRMQFRVGGNIAVLHPKRGAGIAFQNLSLRSARQISDLIQELKQTESDTGTRSG
jgi:hypothetical protein